MQVFLQNIFGSKMFYAPVISWLIAQLIKTTIDTVPILSMWYREKKSFGTDFETSSGGGKKKVFRSVAQNMLWKTGGMPSSHTAMATALVTAVGFQEGTTSAIFFVTFFFTMVIIRDAVGVRRIVGILGYQYNLLVEEHNKKNSKNKIEYIKIVEGHSTSEVSAGAVLGFFVGLVVFLF